MRQSKQEILGLYRACHAKLGKAPGKNKLCKVTELRESGINYYWSRFSTLVKEAGATQNEFTARLDDDFDKIYFVVVGSSVRDSDLIKLTAYLSQAPIRSVAMITAFALIRLVEESIRDRNRFSFVDLDKLLFGKKLIAASHASRELIRGNHRDRATFWLRESWGRPRFPEVTD
ncbi:MAG: hypothetical protein ACYDB8_11275 [Acidiferrobacterales bacterium]